jgi:uncharacterized protein with NRDE domain
MYNAIDIIATPDPTVTTYRSRGGLVADYLQYRTSDANDSDGYLYLKSFQCEQNNYAGFNLLVGNVLLNQYWVFSHAPDDNTRPNEYPDNLITSLSSNTPHVISNTSYPHFNGDIWSKITAGQTNFGQIIADYKKKWQSNLIEINTTTTESFARQLFDMLG